MGARPRVEIGNRVYIGGSFTNMHQNNHPKNPTMATPPMDYVAELDTDGNFKSELVSVRDGGVIEADLTETAVELDAYAPPSSRMRIRTQTSFPSRFARCSAQIRDGCRCTWPKNDSSRL